MINNERSHSVDYAIGRPAKAGGKLNALADTPDLANNSAFFFQRITDLLNKLAGRYHINIEFYNDGICENSLTKKIQLSILKNMDKRIQRIFLCSKADLIIIILRRQQDIISLFISDNG